VKKPPLPARKSTSSVPNAAERQSGRFGASSFTAKHYVVLDTVGNCALVDAKPGAGLKIIGDKGVCVPKTYTRT
jgi:hypothetical protein